MLFRSCREMREKKNIRGEVRFREPIKNELFECTFDEKWLRSETDYFIEYCVRLCDFLLKNIDRREAGKSFPGRGISWKHVDEVWMVGGTSLMPHLQERVIGRLGDSRKLHVAPRPQHAVAEGAAIYADMISSNQIIKGLETSRCPCDLGIMARRRDRWWTRLSSIFFVRKNQSKVIPEFFPLIRSNTRLNDASKCTTTYKSRVVPGSDGKSHLLIYQRFVSRPSRTKYGKTIQPSSSEMQYKFVKLRCITIPDLPPLNDEVDIDHVIYRFTYDPTHTLRVEAEFRGHKLKPIEVREGEFNMLFKADTVK